jgi:hypothetical protein
MATLKRASFAALGVTSVFVASGAATVFFGFDVTLTGVMPLRLNFIGQF